uniref:Uncharacterized protein n=1 Tax=Arundo donax TaxID=35708 RepID=A0A0A9HGL0_ARUDO
MGVQLNPQIFWKIGRILTIIRYQKAKWCQLMLALLADEEEEPNRTMENRSQAS